MLMSELIAKKRDGLELTAEEISFMIDGYTDGSIPDYQMSAMLMAIAIMGMDGRETLDLTMAMVNSGDTLDLSGVEGPTADKHSTGGVGDKTSLVLCPMVASLGVKMAKMSGRGLGHTGGTIDKLESFPGFSAELSPEDFIRIVNDVGFVIAGQTARIAPADKKLYALRDVTATVRSLPLIVSSIMCKKLAAGADVIVLDVKTGSGAFMRTEEDSFELAREMARVGNHAGRKTVAVVTDMDQPLGNAIGNALEVKEAIAVLSGSHEGDLLELCLTLGSNILTAAGVAKTDIAAEEMLLGTIKSGAALGKLAEMIRAQGGDDTMVYKPELLPRALIQRDVRSLKDGYVEALAAEDIGLVSMHLGGGRATKEDVIDQAVGVVLAKKVGDRVKLGEPLATIHANDAEKASEAEALLRRCFTISGTEPEPRRFIKGVVR